MLAGDLREFTLPDLFQLLALTNKTGALQITHDGGEGRVYFRDGEVYFALSEDRRFPLGARLVSSGHLSAERLQQLLRDHKGATAVEVAADLISSGELDEQTLERFVREQIHDALFTLLRLGSGTFEFAADEGPDWPGSRLSPSDALDEAHRRVDEWERLSSHMPSGDAVLCHVPNPPGEAPLALERDQWQLVALVDGKRTVDQLIDLSGKGAFAAGRVISDLVEAGLVEAHQRSGEGALAELLAGRHALRQLEEVALGAGSPASSPRGSSQGLAAPEAHPNGEAPARLDRPVDGQPMLRGRRPSWAAADVDGEGGGARTEDPAPDTAAARAPVVESDDDPAEADQRHDADGQPLAAVDDEVPGLGGSPAAGGTGDGADDAPGAEGAGDATDARDGADDAPGAEGTGDDADDAPGAEGAGDAPDAGAAGHGADDAPGADSQAPGADSQVPAEDADGAPPSGDEGAAAEPGGEDQRGPAPVRQLDRAQVARELSSLGLDDDERRAAPRPATASGAGGSAPRAQELSRPGEASAARLSRDEEINRGLLLRLIDGVKGA